MRSRRLRQAVLNWLNQDADFASRYASAKETGIELLADELLEIADDGRNDRYMDGEGVIRVDHDNVAQSRLRVDTRKGVLSKLLPRKYGDRTSLEHSGPGGGPIQTEITASLDWTRVSTETMHMMQRVMKLAKEEAEEAERLGLPHLELPLEVVE